MLEYEAEEVTRRLRGVLERISTERNERNGLVFCRRLVEKELHHFITNALTADERELAACKTRLFDVRKEADALRKTVSTLESRIANREDLLESQRLAFMKEIIGLKESLFSATRYHEVTRQSTMKGITSPGGMRDTISSRVEPTENCADPVERFQKDKPGLGSFLSGNSQTAVDKRDEDSEEPLQQYQGVSVISEKQKMNILNARLQSAQSRIQSILDEMAGLQRDKVKCERENAELRNKLEYLERFDIKSMRVQVAQLENQLETERSISHKQVTESLARDTESKNLITQLEHRIQETEPQIRSAIQAFSSSVLLDMETLETQVKRSLAQCSNKLRNMTKLTRRTEFSFKYHPEVVQLRRDAAHKTVRIKELERRLRIHEQRYEENRKQELKRLGGSSKRLVYLPATNSKRIGKSFKAGKQTSFSTFRSPASSATFETDVEREFSNAQILQLSTCVEEDTKNNNDQQNWRKPPNTSAFDDTSGKSASDSASEDQMTNRDELQRRATLVGSLATQLSKIERLRSSLELATSKNNGKSQYQHRSLKEELLDIEPKDSSFIGEPLSACPSSDHLLSVATAETESTSLTQLDEVLKQLDDQISKANSNTQLVQQVSRPKDASRTRRSESVVNPREAHTRIVPVQVDRRPIYRTVEQIVQDNDLREKAEREELRQRHRRRS